MSEKFQCGDNTALVGYVYDECEAAERGAIAAHVALCAACAAELAALESTRIQLASWAPPEAELGFAIVRSAAEPKADRVPLAAVPKAVSPSWWKAGWFARPLPAWAQVAAAAVIFATGLSLGIAQGTAPETAQEATTAVTPAPPESVSPGELAALERRLRDEMAQIRTTSTPQPALAEARPSTVNRDAVRDVEEPLMARVRALIDESEQRQQRELALRTTQIVREFDSQRRVDLAQIERNFGQIEGLTGAEVREQRQMLNYLMRVSQQQR